MTIVCGFCHRITGQKEPLDDARKTHGVCDVCGPRRRYGL
jgi:hypothetical protein